MHEHHVDRVHPESVVLDIGGDVGAFILYTDANLRGKEFEISPEATPDNRSHVEVLERVVNHTSVFAATYYGLKEGSYLIWNEDGSVADRVVVTGGEVATVDWRAETKSDSA